MALQVNVDEFLKVLNKFPLGELSEISNCYLEIPWNTVKKVIFKKHTKLNKTSVLSAFKHVIQNNNEHYDSHYLKNKFYLLTLLSKENIILIFKF